jgi:hypothetical protein
MPLSRDGRAQALLQIAHRSATLARTVVTGAMPRAALPSALDALGMLVPTAVIALARTVTTGGRKNAVFEACHLCRAPAGHLSLAPFRFRVDSIVRPVRPGLGGVRRGRERVPPTRTAGGRRQDPKPGSKRSARSNPRERKRSSKLPTSASGRPDIDPSFLHRLRPRVSAPPEGGPGC